MFLYIFCNIAWFAKRVCEQKLMLFMGPWLRPQGLVRSLVVLLIWPACLHLVHAYQSCQQTADCKAQLDIYQNKCFFFQGWNFSSQSKTFFQTALSFSISFFWRDPKPSQPATVTEELTFPYLSTSSSCWHDYSSWRYVRGTPGSRVKAPSDKPVTYLVWCQQGDAALNSKAELCAWRGRLITCQASRCLPRGDKTLQMSLRSNVNLVSKKDGNSAVFRGASFIDLDCANGRRQWEIPAGAAGFTDTGQEWFLNGPDPVPMAF